ncbi:MAG TPA: hypothetical protein VL404_07380 [Candidatus Eisenbacteria bacterium]|nr:hypothetical protein [Candidatus Eisenbacteria bacterium]
MIFAGAALYLSSMRPPGPPPAFLKARWGMGPEAVARANGQALAPSLTPDRFYRVDEKLRAAGRYRALEGRGTFLGREAKVTYAFLDGRLVAYYVFVEDADSERLDAEMRARLAAEFGAGIPVEDGSPLKMIWSKQDLVVNYWLVLDELRMTPKYRAGFGARYLPFENVPPKPPLKK